MKLLGALSVLSPARFFKLLTSDTRNVGRDPTLLFTIFLGFITPICIALFGGKINHAVETSLGLPSFLTYVFPIIAALPAFLIGWVTGFLFLEDRDDGPLMAVEVSPLGKGGFFIYRASISAFISALLVVLTFYLLAGHFEIAMMILLAILVSAETICVALLLPIFAGNKVEGLAVTKIINIAAIVPLLALVPSPARYLAGVIPTFWIGELLLPQEAVSLPLTVIVLLALASHAIWCVILFRVFSKQTSS